MNAEDEAYTRSVLTHIYSHYVTGQYLAHLEVYKARSKGILEPASTKQCVDCGRRACDYDHRDYNEPLQVEPVCRPCNIRRGRAVLKKWSFDEFWSWFAKSGVSTVHRMRWPDLRELLEKKVQSAVQKSSS